MTNENNIMKHFVDRKYYVTCAYARNCLYLLLKALEIGEGDEIIVPAYVCLSIIKAIQEVGAVPVYVDCDKNSPNMAPDLISDMISVKTKMVYVIHSYGISAKIEQIYKIAKANNLYLVEDVSHSYYNEYQDKRLGTYGDYTIVSLTKLIINYQGAFIATDDENIFNKMEKIKMKYNPNTKKVKYLPFYMVRLLSSWFERDGSILSLLCFNIIYIVIRVLKNRHNTSSDFNYDFFFMSKFALFLTKRGIKQSEYIINSKLYEKFREGCSSFLIFPEILEEQSGSFPNYMGGIVKNHKKLCIVFSLSTWSNIHSKDTFSNADNIYSNFRIFSKLFVKVVWYIGKCTNRNKCK